MEIQDQVLEKWKGLIDIAVKYWIKSEPTGVSDADYDILEARAVQEDGFFVRDYVFQTYLKGTKTKNSYIEKIKKFKVSGTMYDAFIESEKELGTSLYYTLKYDGSSIAVYLDPSTGVPKRVVTVGNLNLDNYGVDQTWKLIHFLPRHFPRGIVAIQCEALIDTSRLSESDPQRARQKANGLINSKYCDSEVNSLLTLRAYRYYTDDSPEGISIRNSDYRDVLNLFGTVRSSLDGHVMFSAAQVWKLSELKPEFCESDQTTTKDGRFLNDGWVLYNKNGICQRALKYAGAGSGTEAIKTIVRGIQWNDQTVKGKDSWSANVLVDPVNIKGCTVRKPSAGSISKLIKGNISPGAEIGIVLANSTIPMVGEVFNPGNGDYMWPTCKCGYKLGPSDIYGSLLKCGNPICSERRNRMVSYLKTLSKLEDMDLNKLLVIDRFRWENTNISIPDLLLLVKSQNKTRYYEYLKGFLKTALQYRNLDLVWESSYYAILQDKKL
jgi:hypothetical protein